MDLVDFHSHIIPRADHGSDSVSTSLEQLRLASKYGVSRIVATPHFYPQRSDVDSFLAKRARGYCSLLESIDENAPRIILGAEVLYCENLENLPNLDKLCLGNSRILLLELPFSDFDRGVTRTIRSLIDADYQILLAHADRYSPEDINSILMPGVKIQLNAKSLATLFKNKQLYSWISDGWVVALGSDIHNADEQAYKQFTKAQKKIGAALDGLIRESDRMWQELSSEK